jgi:hypothetical protein
MELKTMSTIKKQSVLFLLMMSCGVKYSEATKPTPGEELIIVLRACLFDDPNKDKTPFREFVAKLLKLLEDPNCAAAIKKEYPNLDIPALILALKNAQSSTSAMMIGFKLRSFFSELPKDLQDTSRLLTGLNRRLAIK